MDCGENRLAVNSSRLQKGFQLFMAENDRNNVARFFRYALSRSNLKSSGNCLVRPSKTI